MRISTPSAGLTAPARPAAGRRFDVLINVPGGGVTLTLILFSLGLVLLLSLRTHEGGLLLGGLTTDNLVAVVTDPLYRMVILRSFVIAGLVTLATVATAYPVAYFIAFHGGRHKRLLLLIVSLPFWTSYLLRVFAWKIVLAYNGVLNSALVGTRLLDAPTTALLNTPAAVVLTLAHAYAAFAILPVYVALDTIRPSLLEAASDLGAKPRQAFLRVVLPLSMPGILSAALVVFVPTVGDYVTPALVGGPASTMIGSIIQSQFGKANDWPFGAAVSVVALAATLLVVLAVAALGRRIGGRA